MQTRIIPKWQERNSERTQGQSFYMTNDMMAEISELRNYVKELEDFRDQVSELPEAFKIYSYVIKTPILVDSLSIAQAIQDSIDNTKIVPLYAYTK